MKKKLEEWRGGILLFLCLVIMINMYTNRISDINNSTDNKRISYYESK